MLTKTTGFFLTVAGLVLLPIACTSDRPDSLAQLPSRTPVHETLPPPYSTKAFTPIATVSETPTPLPTATSTATVSYTIKPTSEPKPERREVYVEEGKLFEWDTEDLEYKSVKLSEDLEAYLGEREITSIEEQEDGTWSLFAEDELVLVRDGDEIEPTDTQRFLDVTTPEGIASVGQWAKDNQWYGYDEYGYARQRYDPTSKEWVDYERPEYWVAMISEYITPFPAEMTQEIPMDKVERMLGPDGQPLPFGVIAEEVTRPEIGHPTFVYFSGILKGAEHIGTSDSGQPEFTKVVLEIPNPYHRQFLVMYYPYQDFTSTMNTYVVPEGERFVFEEKDSIRTGGGISYAEMSDIYAEPRNRGKQVVLALQTNHDVPLYVETYNDAYDQVVNAVKNGEPIVMTKPQLMFPAARVIPESFVRGK